MPDGFLCPLSGEDNGDSVSLAKALLDGSDCSSKWDAGLNPTPLHGADGFGERTTLSLDCLPGTLFSSHQSDGRENPLFACRPKTSGNTLEMNAWLTGPSRQQIVSDFKKTTKHLRAVTSGVHPSLL